MLTHYCCGHSVGPALAIWFSMPVWWAQNVRSSLLSSRFFHGWDTLPLTNQTLWILSPCLEGWWHLVFDYNHINRHVLFCWPLNCLGFNLLFTCKTASCIINTERCCKTVTVIVSQRKIQLNCVLPCAVRQLYLPSLTMCWSKACWVWDVAQHWQTRRNLIYSNIFAGSAAELRAHQKSKIFLCYSSKSCRQSWSRSFSCAQASAQAS